MATGNGRTANAGTDGRAFVLAVVGGGPTCTYVVERLAAIFSSRAPSQPLTLHVFDRNGDFGSGQAHSSRQPRTSVLNRICGQISFGADATNPGVVEAPSLAPFESLHHWCQAKFSATSDRRYLLEADSWPRRYLFGSALEEAFAAYVAHLERVPGIGVRLHACEVVDIVPLRDGRLSIRSEGAPPIEADHVVLATGHGAGRPRPESMEARLEVLSAKGCGTFVPYAYPLEQRISPGAWDRRKSVCSLGLGLTAIDLILYLTEGRGGQFISGKDGLEYRRSGAEPMTIVGCSQSGLFTHARGRNEKESDPARLEHRGIFFTEAAVDRLRATAGTPIHIPGIGIRRQLDFERHVLPVLLLEMSYVYYKALLGPDFAELLRRSVEAGVEHFLAAPNSHNGDLGPFDPILTPIIDETLDAIGGYLAYGDYHSSRAGSRIDDFDALLNAYFNALLGPDFVEAVSGCWADPNVAQNIREGGVRSPWRFSLAPSEHRFDWRALSDPIPKGAHESSRSFVEAVIAFMELDHRRAEQGNVRNPWKAACDGVWRDLRPILTYVVDRGGLTAESHRLFLSRYMRFHNRLANGACLEVMEKMLALIKCGLLDLGAGPLVAIRESRGGDRLEVVGTAGTCEVDTIVDSKLHNFDPEYDESALYRRLFSRSLVRRWRNPGESGQWFEPGGLDLSPCFHPLDARGLEDRRITFLGPPTEGILFFQVGAARPNQNHHVLNDVIAWVEEFETQFRATRAS